MIDRDFEQVSEEHMKSMTKPEGPAQEPHCTCAIERDIYGDIYEPCAFCQANYVPATSAAAREFCESYWPQAHKNTPWEYVAGNKEIMYELMAAYAAQQTAAKDAALEAAEREQDSLREASVKFMERAERDYQDSTDGNFGKLADSKEGKIFLRKVLKL